MKHLLVTVSLAVIFLPGMAFAGTMNNAAFAVTAVPTLQEFGLIGLMVVVGVAAGIAIRRKK